MDVIKIRLTADTGGSVEGIIYLLINFDKLICFSSSFEISCDHLILDPVFKLISGECGKHINNPLLGESRSLFGKIWKVVLQL
jgi:hypothetical protein